MTESDFIDFALSAARRVTKNAGTIGHLVLTQASKQAKPILREPEVLAAFQLEAEAHGLLYGIEVPTRYSYRFTGLGERRALVDFALLESANASSRRNVLVEFKQGQPGGKEATIPNDPRDYPTITKDLHKLIAEDVHFGRCVFHICQAANERTIAAVLEKYNAVTAAAMASAKHTMTQTVMPARGTHASDWFVLMILVYRGDSKIGRCLKEYDWQTDHWQLRNSHILP